MLIMAAEEYGSSGVGVELQPSVTETAWSNVADHELSDQIEIRCENYLDTDLSEADLLVLYLTTRSLHAISDKLREVKPGARIVTHDFPLSGWDLAEQSQWCSERGEQRQLFLYRQSEKKQ